MTRDYEMLNLEEDPYCVACSDCDMQYIPVWAKVSEEYLRDMHAGLLEEDERVRNNEYDKEFEKMYGIPWRYTEQDFEEFLEQMIQEGEVREVKERKTA